MNMLLREGFLVHCHNILMLKEVLIHLDRIPTIDGEPWIHVIASHADLRVSSMFLHTFFVRL